MYSITVGIHKKRGNVNNDAYIILRKGSRLPLGHLGDLSTELQQRMICSSAAHSDWPSRQMSSFRTVPAYGTVASVRGRHYLLAQERLLSETSTPNQLTSCTYSAVPGTYEASKLRTTKPACCSFFVFVFYLVYHCATSSRTANTFFLLTPFSAKQKPRTHRFRTYKVS